MEKLKALLAVVLFVAMLLVMNYDTEKDNPGFRKDTVVHTTGTQSEADTLLIY